MRALVAFLALLLCCPLAEADDDPNYLYSLTFKRGATLTRYAKPEYADGLRSSRPEGVNIGWTLEASEEEAKTLGQQEIDAINLAIGEALKSQKDAVLVLSSIIL